MHHIQRKILSKLLYAESLAYSQMRPEGVESNHFAYHLEQLIRDGLVAKHDKQYFLSPQGLALVDRMSHEKMVDRQQPHILTVISVTNNQGLTLLFKRTFQPYIHRLGYPLGKVHFDETIEQAAVRELQEKTGLTNIALTQRGIVYLTVAHQGFTITKALCHVFEGKLKKPAVTTASYRGSCEWADTANYTASQMMPGFLEIQKLLHANKSELFFAELLYKLD